MKTKWLISVRQGSLENVVEILRAKQVSVTEILDMIGVVIIEINGQEGHL